tara:strand:- start:17 stop:427 length:411 start_codon:yes stop_codon:yes gene_type:complete
MAMDRDKMRNIVLRELHKFNESKPTEQKVSLDASIKRAFDTAQENRGAFNEGDMPQYNDEPDEEGAYDPEAEAPEKPLSAVLYDLGFDAAFPSDDFNSEEYLRKLIDAVAELSNDFNRGLDDGHAEYRDAESRENI